MHHTYAGDSNPHANTLLLRVPTVLSLYLEAKDNCSLINICSLMINIDGQSQYVLSVKSIKVYKPQFSKPFRHFQAKDSQNKKINPRDFTHGKCMLQSIYNNVPITLDLSTITVRKN